MTDFWKAAEEARQRKQRNDRILAQEIRAAKRAQALVITGVVLALVALWLVTR